MMEKFLENEKAAQAADEKHHSEDDKRKLELKMEERRKKDKQKFQLSAKSFYQQPPLNSDH